MNARVSSLSSLALLALPSPAQDAELVPAHPLVFSGSAAASGSEAPPGSAGNTYSYDDGTAEGAASIDPAADVCWVHAFDAVGGVDTIVSVSTMVGLPGGSQALNGRPVRVCVWEDPDDDGDPNDAILLTLTNDVVQQSATGAFVTYPVQPVQVSGTFFVGVIMQLNPDEDGPVGDFHTFLPDKAWAVANIPPGNFNAQNLAANNLPPVTLSSMGVDIPWLLRAEGGSAVTYCTGKLNSLGCFPVIGSTGQPDPNSSSGFVIRAQRVRSNKPGLMCYSITGRAAVPFQGGTLCLATPLLRAPPVFSGGNLGDDCSGVYQVDMNAFAWGNLGGNPAPELLVAGTLVTVQFWGRDKHEPANFSSSLSNALEYTVPIPLPSDD